MQTYQPTTQLPPQREQGSLNSSHQNLAALKSIARCKHSNSESVHGWPGSRLAKLRQAPAIRKHPRSTTLEKCVVTSYKKKNSGGRLITKTHQVIKALGLQKETIAQKYTNHPYHMSATEPSQGAKVKDTGKAGQFLQPGGNPRPSLEVRRDTENPLSLCKTKRGKPPKGRQLQHPKCGNECDKKAQRK